MDDDAIKAETAAVKITAYDMLADNDGQPIGLVPSRFAAIEQQLDEIETRLFAIEARMGEVTVSVDPLGLEFIDRGAPALPIEERAREPLQQSEPFASRSFVNDPGFREWVSEVFARPVRVSELAPEPEAASGKIETSGPRRWAVPGSKCSQAEAGSAHRPEDEDSSPQSGAG